MKEVTIIDNIDNRFFIGSRKIFVDEDSAYNYITKVVEGIPICDIVDIFIQLNLFEVKTVRVETVKP